MVHGYGAKNTANVHISNLFRVLMDSKKRMSLNCMYRMRRRKDSYRPKTPRFL